MNVFVVSYSLPREELPNYHLHHFKATFHASANTKITNY